MSEEPAAFCDHRPVNGDTWRELFGESAWCHDHTFMYWRIFFFSAIVIITGVSFDDWLREHKHQDTDKDGVFGEGVEAKYWMTYMTHWGLMLEIVYFAFAVVTTASAQSRCETCPDLAVRTTKPGFFSTRPGDVPWYAYATWRLQAALLPVSFGIVVFYWIGAENIFFSDPLSHGANFVLMYGDHILSKQPLRLAHVIWPMVAILSYMCFSVVYYLAGGTHKNGVDFAIYEGRLDWSKPLPTSLYFVTSLATVPVLWLFLYSMRKLSFFLRASDAVRAGIVGVSELVTKSSPVDSNGVVRYW